MADVNRTVVVTVEIDVPDDQDLESNVYDAMLTRLEEYVEKAIRDKGIDVTDSIIAIRVTEGDPRP